MSRQAFDAEKLKSDLMTEARAVGLPSGMAEPIATKVADNVSKWVEARGTITRDDLNRQVAYELQQYSADLAYVYENRGKII